MQTDIQVIRDSIGKIVSMLTNRKIRVTQRGIKAYVAYHPKTGAIAQVNIPYLPDDATPDFIAAVQGFLDHEVGHVLHTDPKVLIAAAGMGKKIKNLHNLVEDVYVERKMAEDFAGSTKTLGAVRSFFLAKVSGPKVAEALAAGDRVKATSYALMPAFRAWGGQIVMQDFIKDPVIAELVEPVAKRLGDDLMNRLRKTRNSQQCLDLAVAMHKAMQPPPPPPPPPAPPPPPPPEDDEQDDPTPPALPAPGTGDDEDKEHDDTPPGTPPSGNPPGDDTDPGDDDTDDDTDPGDDDTDDDTDPGDASPSAAGDDDTDDTDTTPSGDDDTDDAGKDPADEDHDATAGTGGATESQDEDDPTGDGGTGDFGEDEEDEEPEEANPSGAGNGEGGSDENAAPVTPDPDGEDLSDVFEEQRDFDEEASEALSKESQHQFAEADYKLYSTEWDKIEPGKQSTNAVEIASLEEGTEGTLGVMQKQLERALAAQARKSWNAGQRRGRISPSSLFKTAVGDDRIFRQRFEVRAKNTAMMLLADISGSMVYTKRLPVAMRTLYALSSVLERLKIVHELMGFTTYGSREMARAMKDDGSTVSGFGEDDYILDTRYSRTEAIYMPIFKGFNERLGTEAKARLGLMMGGEGRKVCRSNVDGESVQIAGHRLMQQTAERRILFVLSDGDPNAMPGGSEAINAMRAHLKLVIKALQARGVEVVGIGIQTHSVAAYYDKYVVLDDLANLSTTVMGELTKILLAP